MKCETWDIFLANVPYEDLPESKVRPVVVLEDGTIVSCIKMTSHPPREGDYSLVYWREAGLHKPTSVRLSKRLMLHCTALIKKIGRLAPPDITALQRLIG